MKTKYHIKTLLAGALFMGFTACAEEDIPQTANGLAGQLHFGSVTVGETHLASRAIVEGTETPQTTFPYNQVITGFSLGDKLALEYSFSQDNDKTSSATYNGTSWAFGANTNIKPDPAKNEEWEDLNVEISFLPVTGDGFVKLSEDNNSPIKRAYYDKLEASTMIDSDAAGSITVIKDLKSSELGKLTVNFRHAHALLRLPFTDEKIEIYNIHEGTLISGKEKLAALWAELKKSAQEVIYVPLTEVTIVNNKYLQAIAPVDYQLTGFKAVLKKTDGENVTNITIDIPLKQGKTLACNNQYNLSLNITNQVSVNLGESDKPGWGDDDDAIVLQQSAINKVLKFNTQKQFEVRDPNGLLELNKWMTGNGGENVKFIEGYGSIDQTKSKLSYDIIIKENISFINVTPTYDLDGDLTRLSNWIPLGTAEEPYTGKIIVEGGALITGLKIHVNKSQKGFVGYLGNGGEVKNLKLQGEFSSNTSNFGAVVGFNDGGIVDGCQTLDGTTVTGIPPTSGTPAYIGGVVGWNNTGLVTNCVNNAKVEAPNHDMVGGVLGENHRLDNCVITNCTNKGEVIGNKHVGGVVGINHRVANNCHNTASVTGDTHVGGVVGMNNDYSPIPDANNKPGWPIYLINGTNTGTVTGKQCVGGVVGSNGSRSDQGGTSGGYIVASWNSGQIELVETSSKATDVLYEAVGGVVGVNYHHEYVQTDWTNEQKTRHGNRTSQIIACYNTGAITAEDDVKVGGVVGVNEAGSKVWASYWNVGVTNGCGDEQNTDPNYLGKEYIKGFVYSKMNEAITKYLVGTAEGGYGIVEGPSDSNYKKYTKAVLIYDSNGKLVNSSTSGSSN